jgi:malate synthase
MTAPFMRAYALLLLKTCHKRGAPAIGGMSALIPIKNDPEKNAIAMPASSATSARRHRRLRRRLGGSPGPGRAGMKEFVKVLGDKPNQFDKQRPDVE